MSSPLKQNTATIQELLNTINSLPEAGTELPELTNEGSASDLLSGKQLINADGNVVTGSIQDFDGSYECSGDSTGGAELPELGDTAAQPKDIAAGKTLYDDDGNPVTGTLYEVKEDGSSFPLDANARLIDHSYGYVITRGAFNDQRAPEGVIVRPGGELWIQMPYTEYGNATADQVLKGATFTSAAGLLVEGTREEPVVETWVLTLEDGSTVEKVVHIE